MIDENNLDFGYVMNRILGNIPDDFDKRETSLIYQSAGMIVPELIAIRYEMNLLENEAFPDSCSYATLERFCKIRNIDLREPTKGIVIAEFDKSVDVGARFNHEQRNFEVIDVYDESKFQYKLMAEETGHIESIGDLTPIQDLYGLTKATILKVEMDGRDEESEESLRARYLESLKSQAFGGNRLDYKDKVLGMDNIGACRLFRRGTHPESDYITIVILDTTYKDASPDLVSVVQNALDPTGTADGLGTTPIGHFVTVIGAKKQVVAIHTKLTLDTAVDLTEDIKKAIDEYLDELRMGFGDDIKTVVRISRIENKLLDIAGVIDVSNTSINGVEANLTVDDSSIPVLGGVTYDRL